jgi:hypothetical protein
MQGRRAKGEGRSNCGSTSALLRTSTFALRTLLAACLIVAAVSAQRPFVATYDATRQIKLEGPVTRLEWVNPRAFVFVDVKDATGTVTNWAIDVGNPLDLEARGWSRSAVRIGDVVRVDAIPARGSNAQASAKSIVLARTSRAIFSPASKRVVSVTVKRPPPRWPDGQVRLGPEPGKKGYWGDASTRTLVDNSLGKVAMSEEGLLVNLSDVDRVAPFQPWARALYLRRQRNFLADDPAGRCLPAGGPRQFQMPNGVQFVEQKELGRILVLSGGGNRNWRAIATDGRAQGQPAEVVLSYYGNSVGKWESKDTLMVDSIGYNERFWFTNGGLPHTEALHLVERFTRTDLNTLKYDVTVEDPRTYTRRWTATSTLAWVADRDIQEYFCEENAESAFVR